MHVEGQRMDGGGVDVDVGVAVVSTSAMSACIATRYACCACESMSGIFAVLRRVSPGVMVDIK